MCTRRWQLTPVIPATQVQRSGGSQFQARPGESFVRPYLKNTQRRKGLVEWLKVKALSSNPSTAKKRKKEKKIDR
jgi:hypothetical protein